MTYQEALKIGKEAEGTIKCTYAELYDKDGTKLFSIQRVKPQKKTVHDTNEEYDSQTVKLGSGLYDIDSSIQLSLVLAEGNPANSRLVPVTLMYDTYTYIVDALKSSHKYPIIKEHIYYKTINGKTYEKGSLIPPDDRIDESKPPIITREITGYEYKAKYKKLIALLDEHILGNKPFYVKPVAFDWHATKARESAEYKAKFTDLSKAKKLFALALLSNVL